MNKLQVLEDNKDYIINKYLNGCNIKDILEEFQCSSSTLYCLFDKNNIKKRGKKNFKYKVNENYFSEIDSEEKAYFLGFIFADGCVYLNDKINNHVLSIELNNKDFDILERFKKSIKADQPIKVYKRRGNLYCKISISNKKICKDLIKLGCIPLKTYDMNFPNIEEKYLNHFIRGFFDGDGSVFIFNNFPKVKFVGPIGFLDKISNILVNIDIYRKPKIYHTDVIAELSIQKKKDVINLYNWLYKDSSIYMDRKYNKFIKIGTI